MVNATPGPLYRRKRDPVPILQGPGWVPGRMKTGVKILPPPTGIRFPARPSRSESLCYVQWCARPFTESLGPGAPDICGFTVSNLLHVTVMTPRIWKWLLGLFWKICTSLCMRTRAESVFCWLSSRALQPFCWLSSRAMQPFCLRHLVIGAHLMLSFFLTNDLTYRNHAHRPCSAGAISRKLVRSRNVLRFWKCGMRGNGCVISGVRPIWKTR